MEAIPPALMAVAMVLQGYLGVSDGDAIEPTVLDLRGQLVLTAWALRAGALPVGV